MWYIDILKTISPYALGEIGSGLRAILFMDSFDLDVAEGDMSAVEGL